ncbi:hypothetical protein IGJ22_001562 [Enterococcus sp. DIV0448]|uniref:hypothetical protein n=1 Tax=Enterococcus TaxID=1350 RepID=UPI00032FA363|nr:hypothetical protein [Enterococcus hirae]EOF60608.1 hypothetical protein SE1_00577 [Enterococcus hirae EnGen0127]
MRFHFSITGAYLDAKKTEEKINRLINLGIFCSIIMAILSVILLLQERYLGHF